jgi:hypothetical protein
MQKNNPCKLHETRKFLKWSCSEEPYSSKERHKKFVEKKKPCVMCGFLCTKELCRKCFYKVNESHLLGKKLPEWWKQKISDGQKKGSGSPFWKGENISYSTKHKFLKKTFGNPARCECCGILGEKNKGNKWSIQWAKKTENYTRNIEDYLGLCTKCHSNFDGKTKHLDDFSCGSNAKYRKGCRCDLCKKAKLLYRHGKIFFGEIIFE